MITYPEKLNNYLWISRKQLGWTRKKLAALIGHETTSQLSRWEDGSQIPNLANALMLGHLLSRPVEELFSALREEVMQEAERRRRDAGEDDGEIVIERQGPRESDMRDGVTGINAAGRKGRV